VIGSSEKQSMNHRKIRIRQNYNMRDYEIKRY
jgi:hypothetical protein